MAERGIAVCGKRRRKAAYKYLWRKPVRRKDMEKIFKKSLALVLSAALCLTALVGCLTVSAADETTPTYAISTDAKGKVGDTVEVIAEYTNISTVCGHYVTVTFPANFTVKEVYQAKESADGETYKLLTAYKEGSEENWQYKVDGSTVTISKTAVAEFGKSGATYADFTFVMSKGQNPTLRVNYVTTYALTANVVDDLGLPISGATVTFTPNDGESGTAAQTLVTDSDGKATVYVKRGSYTLTATHERFTSAITQTTSVSSARTVKMTGEILETVQLVVTNEYGAPLSGAVVSIGGKSITTGTDGTASFSLKRGSYVAQVACTGYSAQSVQLSVTDSIRERVQLK